MEQTTPKVITESTLQKHHFNQIDFDVYEDNGVFISIAKSKVEEKSKD
jgi:hypothetical protein